MQNGTLVPTLIVWECLEAFLLRKYEQCDKFLVDGFPRSFDQVLELDDCRVGYSSKADPDNFSIANSLSEI